MPSWNEYKTIAKERGALAFELYVSHSTPVVPLDEIKPILPEHFAYQAELEAQGKLAFAGPLSDETGELMEGMGLVIYRAASLEEARSLAENDPVHKAGKRQFVLRRWMINEGSISLNVKLSEQNVALG